MKNLIRRTTKNQIRRTLAAYRLRRSIARLERRADRLEAHGNYDGAMSEREVSWELWSDLYILREPVATMVDGPKRSIYLSFYGHGHTLSRRA